MKFTHKCQFGSDRYFPNSQAAKEFVEAFPCSRGKRKSLSKHQYKLLENLGVIPKKDDIFYKNCKSSTDNQELLHECRINDRL